MNKSILLIDTPENCASCQMENINLYDMSKGIVYCQLNKKQEISWENAKNGKPDWCPLKNVPEKRPEPHFTSETAYLLGVDKGWNNCIDEILKED